MVAIAAATPPRHTLYIDIETYSAEDLKKVGVYRYSDSPTFELLLFGYAYDSEPVRVVDIAAGEPIPAEVLQDLTNANILKSAFNAAFELACLSKFIGQELPVEQWKCTMIQGLYQGLPGSLAQVAQVLELPEQKMKEGRALISYFCVPCKATKTNGGRTRNLAKHAPERWEVFMRYCAADVDTERAISNSLPLTLPQSEQELWALDININRRGVLLDKELYTNAIAVSEAAREEDLSEMQQRTLLANPNSPSQLKQWLGVEQLRAADVTELIETTSDPNVKRVLELRQQLSKTSTSKYTAMEACACDDGRARGLLQFYGASRTGRWAGRLIQVQNLPRNYRKDLHEIREVLKRSPALFRALEGDEAADALSQLIRTAIVAPEGSSFLVADYSAIEARVIAWLSGEQWRLDVFNGDGRIYEASAARMFNVPIEEVDKNLRAKGKVAELALGYGGSVGALKAMGAERMGLEEWELQPIVTQWRNANTHIGQLWTDFEDAAKRAAMGLGSSTVKGVKFELINDDRDLAIELPSGRALIYRDVALRPNRYGHPELNYMGQNQTTRKWEAVSTYGGKLVENVVQAIARDCLAVCLKRLEVLGFKTVMHVHDEVIVEGHPDQLDEVLATMSQPIQWAQGLPLRGEGFTTPYYLKD